ncbi:hypothetical protein AQPW35_41830 [Rubrivivax pictus]|uniref:Carbohydrate binding module xylan-binding domain-containing protein n=2 Tax=Pseudaquabacterium pictum TaxID=2315236 RepID=A0A480AXX9_9BURK|nr:hypothetical protein AQPW35_41830 [Rubrivivax pictus]
MKQALAVADSNEAPGTILTVRAHGRLAGGVGPIMEVLVDGVRIGTTEVRDTQPTDFRFASPALRPGAKVDVVFTNNALVGTEDRDLIVTQVTSASTYSLPTDPGVVYDVGKDAEAFDGINASAGRINMSSSGALRFTWPEPNLTAQITVRASASLADNTGALMSLRVNGVTIGPVEVRSTTPADHTFTVPAFSQGSRIDVVYSNDATINGLDRNLNVHYLRAGTTVLLPSAAGVLYDLGEGTAAFDGANTSPGQATLHSNGALRAAWAAANMTDTLTVRASGVAAGDVWPLMQVVADGILLGSTEVRSTEPADFRFAALPLRPGAQIQVLLANPGSASGVSRSLNVSYAISGTTVLRPGDAGVTANASGAAGAWPAPNLTDMLTVRAKGTVAANVGAIMQVLVDGIMVGTTEVRNTDFADFSFPALPMQPGRKVDVVFTNNEFVGGVDRDLFVAYLTTANTAVRPTDPGVTYDVGKGSKAFDGLDLSHHRGAMFHSGALRFTWPQANITSTLTVRASGTAAGNVAPIMQLWVDGILVSSTQVTATYLTDHAMLSPVLKPGSKVELLLANPGTVNGVQRALVTTYAMAGNTVLQQADSSSTTGGVELRGTWPSANLTSTLTVRAHGRLAGGVGPIMEVLVDGVRIGTTEVRDTQPTDFQFASPALRPGAKVDVVFTNNALVGTEDRDLIVTQVTSASTYSLPTDPGVVYDVGKDAEAFDGINASAGRINMPSSGALRFTWPEPNLTAQITVRASASLADNTGALMSLRVNGVTIGPVEVRSTTPADHTFTVPAFSQGSRIDVVYSNDATINGLDRNLNVHYLRAGTTVLLPSAAGVLYDLGEGTAAFDGANTSPGQATLHSNGALRAAWPAANMTDTLTVRASASLAAGIGAVMQVRVDGVVLGTTEVKSTTPADYSFATLPITADSQVDLVYTNDAVINGEDRNLNVSYLISSTTVLRPTAPGITYDLGSGIAAFDGINTVAGRSAMTANGALRAAWPTPNLTDSLTVRAHGRLAGNVGPSMELHVDGVIVARAEVRATEPTDHTFAVPTLLPGTRIDVVLTNHAVVAGVDRNLVVDYLIAGKTFMLPTAPGNSYDIGTGAAAFDGQDVRPGQRTLNSNAALRMQWAQPNITDHLIVRAHGQLAGSAGPVMQVWVDGVAVSSVEVRSTTPADYIMPVPPLKAGSRIDVAYTNDAVVNGADRNLNVAYLLAGSTYMLTTSPLVQYDLGLGAAAFDGLNVLAGQPGMALNGALRLIWPAANIQDSLLVRASSTLAAGVGALMQVRVDGVIVGTVEVRSSTPADHMFTVPRLTAGSRIDVAFLNNAVINGEDRNLFVQYLKVGNNTLMPTAPSVTRDYGVGEAAFDSNDTTAGDSTLYSSGALRFTVPALPATDATLTAQYAAARFLQQATFGPTAAEVQRLSTLPLSTWLAEQMAMPAQPDFVRYVQGKFDLGDDYRPKGKNYSIAWPAQRFWATAANGPDQLRKRVAFALHQILMVSQADSNLHEHSRAYASYLDILNQHAFGNYRNLLEAVSLSPAMGIYLSHMRNRREDPISGRLPDENFARELMQLFTIGLHELNSDGSPRLDSSGQPIETYDNQDVMALAKVFTGFSWAFPDAQLTDPAFRWGRPDYLTAADQRVDVLPMKAYPGQHSAAEKRLFSGKPHAMVIPANSTAQDSVRLALDALFMHPNVGPFIGRQLIQRLVTSHPSAGYVARVAAAFNNNGAGVRGDMAAVVRAVLLDAEARNPPADAIGKLREPVLRVTQWMRGMDAKSQSGQYLMAMELANQGQRALYAPSVFGYFRPGFVPPNSAFSGNSITVPELQIVNESTTAHWVNLALAMASGGLGQSDTGRDVSSNLEPLVALATAGNIDALIERLNLLMMAGRMSPGLRQDLLDAIADIRGTTASSHLNRARVALFLTMASPEYLVQR